MTAQRCRRMKSDAAAQPKPEKTLGSRVVSASVWSVGAYVVGFVIRLGSNLVLTRLLSPEDFGLITLLNVVIAGLYLFSDFGVGPCIIRSPRGDEPSFLDTAWTLTLARGLGLFIIACGLSYPASLFYDAPELAYLLPTLASGTVLLGSCRSTKVNTAERHLDALRVNLYDLINQVVTVVIMVAWALVSPSVWALVAGSMVSSGVHVVLSFTMFPGHNNRLRWDKSALKEMASFGRWIMLSTALMFLATQTDRAVLGKLVPFATLGAIGIGLQLADMPKQVLTRLCNQVLLPAMSKIMHLGRDEFHALIERQRWRVLPAAAVLFALGCAVSDIAVDVLYDDRYAIAGSVVAIMLLSAWVALLSMSVDPALVALGKPQYGSVANGGVALCNVTAIPLAFAAYGVPGAIGAMAARQLVYYAVITAGLRREKLACVRQDAILTAMFLLLLALLVGVRLALGFGHPFVFITG